MIVYLLHYPDRATCAHYLGKADSEDAIDFTRIPHGLGYRRFDPDEPEPQIADVWEASTAAQQDALYWRLWKQGGRKRLCSICTPGNARGAGTGNWERE